jgi:3-hydroxyisobutyrate dehydrogenase-like beta-hydroxyacid dehydrogenase
MEQTIGFIGVGNMGAAMARNLLADGYTLRVFDVLPDRAAALVPYGAIQVACAADTVVPDGIVISMVPNDQALTEIVSGDYGILTRLDGGIHVSMSTVAIQHTQKLTDLYASRGCTYLAATVSGRPDVAAARQLSIFYAGNQDAKTRVLPLLSRLGNSERLYDLGELPVAAMAVKIAFNYNIPIAILSMAASAALAERYGVPRAVFLDLLLRSPLFSGTVHREYGRMIAQDNFQPALFPVDLGLKDTELMLYESDYAGVFLPGISFFRECLQQALAHGWGKEDWAVAARAFFQDVSQTALWRDEENHG